MLRRLGLACLLALAACGPRPAAPPRAPAATPAPAAPAPAIDRDRLTWWRALASRDPVSPATAATLVPELEAMLASPDPSVRDGIAYEVFARWLAAEGPLTPAVVADLRARLVARTAAAPVAGDAVFARSFAALVLSVIAAREVASPAWTDAELDGQIAAATAYASHERDLRGHTGKTGWAHAPAHTADWMKFLARHPRLTAVQAGRLLDGVTALVARRRAVRFCHGEDERLAAAVRAVLRRGLATGAQLDAWLVRVAAPIALGWPDPFDPVVYAAQRNARDLLVSTFVALSFDDAPPAVAALARLRAFMTR